MKTKPYHSVLVVCVLCFSCSSPKEKVDEFGLNTEPDAQTEEPQRKSIPVILTEKELKSTAVLIGDAFTVLDESHRSIASTELRTGMLVTILAISEQKYPKNGSEDFCDQFPYVKIKSDTTETWILGSEVYEYNEEIQERVISIGRNYYQIKRTRNFGIGAEDEDGFTDCDEYYPLLLKENSGKAYCLISLKDSEKNQPGFGYGNIKINEEILSIETDSTKAVFKIDAVYMEDAETYELHIQKVAEGLFEGKIKNRRYRLTYPDVPRYDMSVYDPIVPQRLKEYLLREFAGWSLPSPGIWDPFWFHEYKTDTSTVTFISGDFNCDRHKDYAFYLINEGTNQIARIFLHGTSTESNFEIGRKSVSGPLHDMNDFGFLVGPPGEYDSFDPDIDDPPKMIAECNTITEIYFEQSAGTFIWDGNEYKLLWTAD